MEIEATATNALDAALTELRRSPIEGPHPTSASDARAWADARGYAWGDDAAHLAAFLECEARAAKLAAAKRARAAPAGAVRKLRAAALARSSARRTPTARRRTPWRRVRRRRAEAGGPALGADPAPATPEQRAKLEAVRDAMRTDYALRRRMMLKRCGATVQAFLWSDSARGNEDAIVSAVAAARDAIGGEPPPSPSTTRARARGARDIAAARAAHLRHVQAWQQRTEGGKGGKGRGAAGRGGGGGGKGRGGGRGKKRANEF
ncbi:hypothetical protein SO694_00006266 [Aureococcus anophagefferens]|uniref:Uncharacterized protein n=1 Tax=Aureococcus anophagefferens TaxID=44056 RepID=A0ABR1GAC1_AURAN